LRVLAVHADVVVATILPDELELLPAVAAQADFRIVALLATHGDWDHLLGRLAFAELPLGVPESTADRLNANPGAAQRGLREFDDEHYVVRSGPLALGTPQRLPAPGRLGLGDAELDLYPVGGHTADGMAIGVPWAKVLIAGDHLSPVEIPMVGERPDSLDAYLTTLDRLEPLVAAADTVVPGHGEPLDSERALAILREDRDYLRALAARGAAASLPLARRGQAQKAIHHANVGRVVPA
jgi:glyoxylase-like metal-dependent hydrolase (beta-lactamase superfamily II)